MHLACLMQIVSVIYRVLTKKYDYASKNIMYHLLLFAIIENFDNTNIKQQLLFVPFTSF